MWAGKSVIFRAGWRCCALGSTGARKPTSFLSWQSASFFSFGRFFSTAFKRLGAGHTLWRGTACCGVNGQCDPQALVLTARSQTGCAISGGRVRLEEVGNWRLPWKVALVPRLLALYFPYPINDEPSSPSHDAPHKYTGHQVNRGRNLLKP